MKVAKMPMESTESSTDYSLVSVDLSLNQQLGVGKSLNAEAFTTTEIYFFVGFHWPTTSSAQVSL